MTQRWITKVPKTAEKSLQQSLNAARHRAVIRSGTNHGLRMYGEM
jgi:hypothetical protein